ncbi:T9SS type A sorting domain-containing protein [Flavitalea antarctica]
MSETLLNRLLSIRSILPCLIFIMDFFSNTVYSQSHYRITEIITDFNGYWKSGAGAINPVKPDNSHNLLAFSHSGVRYSTGVNDASLVSHGDQFVAGDYRALPVSTITGSVTGNTKIGLGEQYDGVTNGKSNPSPTNNIPFYLTDGIKGLNIGTCVANLPAGSLSFAISNIQLAAINDNVPDIIITQTADPSGGEFDRYEFTDINGNRIGNHVDIILSNIPAVGTWVADFYEASLNPMSLGAGFTKTERALRLWTGDFGVFGINATNISRIAYFKITLSGSSDVGFVAYNNNAFNVNLVLPTILKSFTGKTAGNNIQLNWNTESESNSDKFIVERSSDGSSFTAIGTVDAAGNSNRPKQYTFTTNGNKKNSYFRLKMLDIDGKSKYSPVVTVNGFGPETITVSAFPNPASGYVFISHPGRSAGGTIKLYNALGILMTQLAADGDKSRIDLTRFTKGNYHVVYDGDPEVKGITIVKQ